jgi:hypothetical protein
MIRLASLAYSFISFVRVPALSDPVRVPNEAKSYKLQAHRPAAMLLTTVLIMGATALTISLSIALRSIGELDMGFAGNQSQEVFAAADGCMEDALRHLWADYSYTGATLTIDDTLCTITVTSVGTRRTVNVTGVLDRWTRRLTAEVDLTGTGVTLREWVQVE